MRHFALLCLGLAACSDAKNASGPCTSNDRCSPGQICTGGSCVPLCANDAACPAGQVCQQSLCVSGVRSSPRILDVNGDGSSDCASDTGNACITGGLSIT